jgi:hypothetical protein
MAVCLDCHQEMLEADGCTARPTMVLGGRTFVPVVHGAERAFPRHFKGRCHDCGVAVGKRHHFGCDFEHCPRCARQIISCGCLDGVDTERDSWWLYGAEADEAEGSAM